MTEKATKFLYANGSLKHMFRKINTIDELRDLPNQQIPNSRMVHNVNLSNLDLSKYNKLIEGDLPSLYTPATEAAKQDMIISWTDSVIWPSKDKMPMGVSPLDILEKSKQPKGMSKLHTNSITGKNIGIAIIDQRLNLEHPEYKDRLKHYEVVGDWPNDNKTSPDMHGSLVSGLSVGKTCGTAPGADLYYFAANNWPVPNQHNLKLEMGHRLFDMMAIRRILEINKTLPENKKIRFLSCSWGQKNDMYTKECEELFTECEKHGIMVIGGSYKIKPIIKCDSRYPIKQYTSIEERKLAPQPIGIPTDGKTSPFYLGGYKYTRQGGNSSVPPYLAGVFACACQDNQIFFMRPNWQDELFKILEETAITDKNGGKMINPIGIRERVTQIAREMEMNIIKQQSLQNE